MPFFLKMALCCSLMSTVAQISVKCPRKTVVKMEESSVSFECSVDYNLQDCDVDSVWQSVENSTFSLPIADSNRYTITVNERERGMDRQRNVLLTFKSLSSSDTGIYQCEAKCLNTDIKAKGHLVTLNVTADPNKGVGISLWSGKLKTDTVTLALSIIIFLYWY
ncbi:hypothetical protein DNTS_000079 [Danionella cerebrum]|uniref:Ig-like domain-containing protein n=1 Tax=Danionella cerebrum TaxID=2873325 RepID=A0A553RJZ5_9TELE|nr:hypothetical protein DNTS_000079 [Danionella translucida]